MEEEEKAAKGDGDEPRCDGRLLDHSQGLRHPNGVPAALLLAGGARCLSHI